MSIKFKNILELMHCSADIEVEPLLLKCNKCRVLNILKSDLRTNGIGQLYVEYSFDECCQCKSYDNLVIECKEFTYNKRYFLKFIPYRKLVKTQIVTYNVGELLWKLN